MSDKICPVCGEPWLFSLKTWQDGDEKTCEHDNMKTGGNETEKYKNHLEKRAKIVERHNRGDLPGGYYSKKKNPQTGKTEKFLSPKKLMSSKSILR